MFNSSLGEFFKLPDFFTHFAEHQTQDTSIGIVDFIWMHYLGNDNNDKDQDRDMQLPFKKVDGHFSFQIAVIPSTRFISESRFESIDSYLQISFKNRQPKNPLLVTLFRPPCLV